MRRREFFSFFLFTTFAIACSESKENCPENDRDFSAVKNFFQISYLLRFNVTENSRNARLAFARKSVACEIAAKEIENERIRISTIKPVAAPIGRGSLN